MVRNEKLSFKLLFLFSKIEIKLISIKVDFSKKNLSFIFPLLSPFEFPSYSISTSAINVFWVSKWPILIDMWNHSARYSKIFFPQFSGKQKENVAQINTSGRNLFYSKLRSVRNIGSLPVNGFWSFSRWFGNQITEPLKPKQLHRLLFAGLSLYF